MPGAAKERWALLAQALRSREGGVKEKKQEGTKRSFHAYNLLTWGAEDQEGWRAVSHSGVEAEVRLAPAATSPSLTQLVGFNNTGNVCVWPSEECLGVYCLAERSKYEGLRVLELGGGMTAAAGLLLAASGTPCSVTLTDGNEVSAQSLVKVVERAKKREGMSSLEALQLRWDDASEVEARRGSFDLILSADCIFFTSQLASAMATLLAPGGEALVMAPGREGTFDTFQAEAKEHFGEVEEVEKYSAQVWKAHEACCGLESYVEDIHYPRLLRCRL